LNGKLGSLTCKHDKACCSKGYRLVAANRKGFNMFFKNDLLKNEIPGLKIEDLLNDPSVKRIFMTPKK